MELDLRVQAIEQQRERDARRILRVSEALSREPVCCREHGGAVEDEAPSSAWTRLAALVAGALHAPASQRQA